MLEIEGIDLVCKNEASYDMIYMKIIKIKYYGCLTFKIYSELPPLTCADLEILVEIFEIKCLTYISLYYYMNFII